jgi:hypothetical protein
MKYRSRSVPSPLVLAPRRRSVIGPPGWQERFIWGVALAPIYALAVMTAKGVFVML